MLAKDFVWGDGSCRKFMLEPYAVKVARTVLRGGKSERIYLSQLFNSMTHEKPYHNLNSCFLYISKYIITSITQVLHGCLQLMLWNCGLVHVINENPCFICKLKKIKYFAFIWVMIKGIKTSHHGLDVVGYRRATCS